MAVFETDGGMIFASDKPLGGGGRGSVFPVIWADGDSGLAEWDVVCKVVAPRFRSAGRRRKVELLRKLGESSDIQGVAWPVSNLYEEGEWAGYVMRRARGRSLGEVRADESVPFAKKVELARRMCQLVDRMHGFGVVVGDVSMANVLYDASLDELVLIDIDSAQVVDEASRSVYPTTESREKSPEMLQGALGEVALTSRSDDYLLAVEVFRLLFDAHPLDEYRKDVPPAKVRAENARRRRFAYEATGAGCGIEVLGAPLAKLFRRSFGGAYEGVPSAAAYAEVLRELERASFESCHRCGGVHVAGASQALRSGGSMVSRAAALACALCLVQMAAVYAPDAALQLAAVPGDLAVQVEAFADAALGWLDGFAASTVGTLDAAWQWFASL